MVIWNVLKKFGGWILAAVSFLGMLLLWNRKSREQGKREGELIASKEREHTATKIANEREAIAAKQVERERIANNEQIETLGKSDDVKAEISRLPDSDVVDRLRSKWSRD